MNNELYHWGVKGMKWGRRKAPDSTSGEQSTSRQSTDDDYQRARREKIKKAVIIGTAVAGTAIAAYGAYRMSTALKDKAFNHAMERGNKAIEGYMRRDYMPKHVDVHRGGKRREYNKAYNKALALKMKLGDYNESDARQASRNTVAAVKELMGRNRKIPVATLLEMGINVAGFEDYVRR